MVFRKLVCWSKGLLEIFPCNLQLAPFIVLILLTVPHSIHAQEDNGVTLDATIGFDGFFKTEFWVPVRIAVANSGPEINGELRVTIGNSTFGEETVYSSPISLPTQSNKQLSIYVNLERVVNPTVGLYNEKGELVKKASLNSVSQVAADGLLYGVVSSSPGEFSFLENVAAKRPSTAVSFLSMDELPETAVSWGALDILIFNDVDTGELTAAQQEALRAWIDIGGQLVITGGGNWQKTATALADLLPVNISSSESVDDLPTFSQTIGEPFRDAGPYLVTSSSLANGELLYHENGLPLLAVQSVGAGSVYFLALDPALAPLLDWDGSELLWTAVAQRVPTQPLWAMPVQNDYAARASVTSLPSLALPSAGQFVFFLFVYIIIIGPVNYMVLKRRKQLEKAWLTIPAIIILFSGMAYLTGFQLRGNDVLINQMSIAYSRAEGDQAKVQSFIGLYSPKRANYDLVVPNGSLIRPFTVEFGPGGNSNFDSISYSNDVTVKNVRVDISDVETFYVNSTQPAIAVTGQAMLEAKDGALILSATIQNNGDQDLETATLLLGDTIITVGDLDAGDIKTISQRVGTISTSGDPTFNVGTGGIFLNGYTTQILGSSNYYNDDKLYPRYQLLEAFSNYNATVSTVRPTNVVTLIAWADTIQVDAELDKSSFDVAGTTLYFIELPLTQQLVSGEELSIPLSLLTWNVLAQNNLYEPSVQNLSLNGGWVEFEYEPWADFAGVQMAQLAIVLETEDEFGAVPEVRLWDWQQAVWVVVEDVSWGETAVSDYTPYIGPNNAVRIRLQDNSQFGVYIQTVYPKLTGNLK